ncbi:RNA helicase [Gammaproteobacteria bacterium 45_16_T64]|nr:RNA helicase [Gammaproteobacteria bacterium 45_16_T64]
MFSELALNDRLLKAITKLGFEKTTPVQAQAIPLALAGKDLLVSAKTGSGKTAAFLLPSLHRFLENPAPDSGTRALILVPTRELARQVLKQCSQFADFTNIKSTMIIGGEDFKFQKSQFRKNPEIVIATPGRLVEHLDAGSIDFKDLEVLVLDEADRMLDMGFVEDVMHIAKACNNKRQTLLFSATLKQRGLEEIIGEALNEPEKLILDTHKDEHSQIRQQAVLADDNDHKDKLLATLLENETYNKALVFTNKKVQATRLCGLMRYKNNRAGVLQGDLSQEERNHVMSLFRNGQVNVLIATDVAARGIDVDGIDLVINYDMPRNGDDYIHRIGRTGRADSEGVAISFVTSFEWNLKAAIERYLRHNFEKRTIKGFEGKFKGPKKLKSSGKSAGAKKFKQEKKGEAEKTKNRLRDKKNVGKRRKPSTKPEPGSNTHKRSDAGFEPPKKRI